MITDITTNSHAGSVVVDAPNGSSEQINAASHAHHHHHHHHAHHSRNKNTRDKIQNDGSEILTAGVASISSTTSIPPPPMPATLPSGLLNPVPPIEHIDPYLLPSPAPTPSSFGVGGGILPPPKKSTKDDMSKSDGSTLLLPLPNEADLANLDQSKKIKFEEEPADSYIVGRKSTILRCITLNALNSWFTCNSGDERRVQSNQKINNYVDPQTGVRLVSLFVFAWTFFSFHFDNLHYVCVCCLLSNLSILTMLPTCQTSCSVASSFKSVSYNILVCQYF